MKQIYLDYNATTPVDPRVFEKMRPYFSEAFGNSVSLTHAWGWQAEDAVNKARSQVANLLHCEPKEIIFTSGATESNNWTVLGLVDQIRSEDPQAKIHLITSPVEHSSVRNSFQYVQKYRGVDISWAPINRYGQVDVDKLKNLIRPETKLMSFMWVNNEIGSINPMQELAALAKERKVYLHTDATQALGKVPVDLQKTPIDLLSFSAHKIYGPKGVGVLFIRGKNPTVQIAPLISGGGHERGLRSGTLNTPGVVGLGEACAIAKSEGLETAENIKELRDFFWKKLQEIFPGVQLNGHPTERSPNNLNVTFVGYEVPAEIATVAVSRGSACLSGTVSTSAVLQALGYDEEKAKQTLRLSLGQGLTREDIEFACQALQRQIRKQL